MRIIGSLGLIVLFGVQLFGAHASLLKPTIESGESATLILSVKGDKIQIPTIEQIDGFSVVSRQSRQSLELSNGVMSKQVEYSFTFYPDRNVTIPSYEISVDGTKEMTEVLHVNLSSKSSSTPPPFSFEMHVSNPSPLQHEGVKLSFVFKRNPNETIMDMRFFKPTLEGFWVKELGKDNPQMQNGEIVHTISYMLYPQKSGEFHIEPAKIEVARQISSREMFFNQVQWKSVLSNALTLHVKPLEGADLLGHFTMQLSVDKEAITSNEPLNVTLTIQGEGNLDDIEPFKLEIPDATIFSDAPKVTTRLEGETLKGEFVQKFAINAQKSFTINPLELSFYDPALKRIERIATHSQSIVVHALPTHVEKGVAKNEAIKSEASWQFEVRSFLLGMAFMVLLGLGGWSIKQFQKVQNPFGQKDQKQLLQKLLKYQGRSQEVDHWIEMLEANLYRGEKHPVDQKAIRRFLENLM